ncbi:MAG: GHMP kinase [Proteobacteria bacterium]|nr:GHMP kinase [Pseudomonadota bacterium]MBU1596125.1 GHMP kinase [Pseudomonadota bacterium]
MIISRTPMRVSFLGGGSDLAVYYGRGYGQVLSTAIDRYIFITVNRKFDDLIRVSYSKTEMVDHVDKVEHNIIREAMKIVGVERGVDIVYMGDIPLGTAGIGLGSSSSLAVGVLNALYAYVGKHVSAERLAREACEIEIDRLGHPMGKQDQYAAAYGGFNRYRFNKDESVFVDPIIWRRATREALNAKLLMFYTGVERHSSTILADQQDGIRDNAGYLDQMVALSETMREMLVKNDLHAVGELLHQGWMGKRKLAPGVTSPRIDELYELARGAGAVGGKILGAGGGGFLMLYAEEADQDRVRQALADLKETPFRFEPQGSKIIYVSD